MIKHLLALRNRPVEVDGERNIGVDSEDALISQSQTPVSSQSQILKWVAKLRGSIRLDMNVDANPSCLPKRKFSDAPADLDSESTIVGETDGDKKPQRKKT